VYSSVSGETDTLEELDPVRLRLPTLDERLGLKVQNLLKDPRNRKWIDSWRLYQNVELAKSVADTVVKNWDECTGGRDIDYIVSVSELGIPFAMYVAYAAREHKKFHGNVLRCDPAAPVSGRWLFPDIGVGTLKDKNVLLVDEIMTSGSHARAAAELFLLQAKSHLAGFVVLLQNEGEYNFSNIRKLTEMVPNAISVAGTSLSGLGAWARRQGLFIRF